MLANLLAGIVAWRIARKKHHEAPWVAGAIGLFVPLAGLWAAMQPPPEDAQGGQG